MRLYDYDASANCFKVRLLLGFLGAGYERVPIDIFAGDTLTDAYAQLNPARETPVLELDDGRVITESRMMAALLATGRAALERLDAVLATQSFLLGETPTIADLAVYGYAHLADEVGLVGFPAVDAWCERLRALPGFAGELAPYPENSMAG